MSYLKFGFFVLVLFSCRKNINSLEKSAKTQADSLFQLEYNLLNKELDSLCEINKQARKKFMLDSVVMVRKQEIIELQKGL